MSWGPLLLCGWPGLPGLWYRGQMSSLLVSIGFSVLLNVALISTFLWPWSLGETFPLVAWPVILLVWGTSACVAYRGLTDVMTVPFSEKVAVPERPDTLFIQAQSEYLRGHWEEAESLLSRRIENAPRDMESRLLLATMSRHSRRLEQATLHLNNMERFDESTEWRFEVDRERKLIELIRCHEQAEEHLEQNDDFDDALPDNNDGFIRSKNQPLTEPVELD
ncbi:MAG: hypothetical protein P8J27_05730 [Mariniblastus sp.]|nr:hypothetical protein [Mariniblastus sp.]